MANLTKQEYMNKQNLKMAFDFFDENHDGNISMRELKRIFSTVQSQAALENIINEIDFNKDGKVNSYII